jgi:DNA-directed RNA polymerase subunit RPC12/RpoP
VLSSNGVEIGGPIPVSKKPVNGFDLRDVPAETLIGIADPAVDPKIKLEAYIQLKRNEQYQQHRKNMEENGQECDECGMLYVLNHTKPWTLLGTCSKFCCAKKLGVSDYAMAEELVAQQIADLAPQVKQRSRDNLSIHVTCASCQHAFNLPKIYSGIYRKCPSCDAKILVP